MRLGERVFVDSGAWIALAVAGDPYHAQAESGWQVLQASSARLVSSVPVMIETFTFLDRNASRDDALRWRQSVAAVRRLAIITCTARDLAAAWRELEQTRLQGLSLVDASSFVLMRARGIARAFAFDYHFTAVGFQPVA
ncbi:MAG: type II toxin-antitoxin system VapC family toxin [Terriglobales bacterium]